MTERTDRELLELAAKAAGYEVSECTCKAELRITNSPRGYGHWNPITNDGDTFRLMVALGIRPEFDGHAELAMQDELYRVRREVVRLAAAMAEGGEQ